MPFTTEAVIVISHYDVKPGHLRAFYAMWDAMVMDFERAKPRTAAYLGVQNEGGGELTLIQVFPDGAAVDAHFSGADDRSRSAYEHIQPAGWEVYGPAPAEFLTQLGDAALAAGVDLVIQPRALGGFLRTTVG
jgi:quinol monooxygenase YgiN